MTSPGQEPGGGEGLGLRARQRQQVLADIRRAAFGLFIQHGFDEVTTEQVAAAAGVSQRTLFRYVSTKEDLLLEPLRQGGPAIVDHLAQRPAAEQADQALVAAISARTAAFPEADAKQWRRALLATGLLARATLVSPADREQLVVLVAERMGVDPVADHRPGLLVHLSLAAGDHGFQRWVAQPRRSPRTLVEWVDESLRAVTGPHWARS